jgi:tetratricopeptide (TPR) repeat protein
MKHQVKVWKEIVVIPTYEIGEPEKNPVFLENRVYQGSSGKVYPHQVIEKISDEKVDKEWQAVYLENDFVKIMILPELGGRVQMAYDKTKERHFVYYNQVIKPALVGLTGPWISGGIEFNWPQHHRPSTYSPVDFNIEENADGSKTVWCSEVERMFRTKGMTGFTLYPDKAYLEIKAKLYNRTPQPQTFLWWANPAVKVNDDYQSVFPPDVHAVFDHGKRDVSDFPIATGTYYKVDYSPGTDISRYKNIPVPTSYMAINSDYNFVGGYENDSKAGLLHVADHHVSPGKKQWTWGDGEFGKAWDKNLTDEDGPYIELMCGVYTDNQPDFSWMHPFEEKTFSQYFMSYRDVGVVKNATKEAVLNLEFEEGIATIKLYTLGVYPKAKVLLESDNKIFLEEQIDASPESSYERKITIDTELPLSSYKLTLYDENGKVLVSYQPESFEKEMPDAAQPAKAPDEIESIEQLFLGGLHLEQYRHATYNPTDYYLEGLKREPGDVRCNNAMGLLLIRKGQFEQAEPFFRKAIDTLTERNPNPYDGEPYYNLGQCLKYQGKFDEAYAAFYKSAWNAAWQDAAYFHLAQIACLQSNLELALELVEKSLVRNWHNHKARVLKISLLRKTGQNEKASRLITDSLEIDAFNFGALYEKYLLKSDASNLVQLKELMRGNIHNYIEYAIDYAAAGLFDEAVSLINVEEDIKNTDPMALYFNAWFEIKRGETDSVIDLIQKAETTKVDGCFAYRLEAIEALESVVSIQPKAAKANYHLGNFWYDRRQYSEAIVHWENSRELDDQFPTVHRNLALAYFNKKDDRVQALSALEVAFKLDTSDARIFMELDQLYKRLNYPLEERLDFLEKYPKLVDFRDDLYLERCTLYNLLGQYSKSLNLLMNRQFHPWEGGEGKVTGQYLFALVALARDAISVNKFEEAIELLERTVRYPDNLGEGKLDGAQENDIHFWLGCAYEGLGKIDQAKKYWEMGRIGLSEPSAAVFYNDQQPDKIFYQGISLIKLGNEKEAKIRFDNLIYYGESHMLDTVKIDYFAVSLPDLLIWEDDLNVKNKIHCHYLIGLGKLGLGNKDKANHEFDLVLMDDTCHSGATIHKCLLYNLNSVPMK